MFVYVVRMIKGIQLFSVSKMFNCLLISPCHLTFTIIFYYHAVMNTFIQWQETISDAYLTDTPSCFLFIEPNISPLPQGSLASVPSNALILLLQFGWSLDWQRIVSLLSNISSIQFCDTSNVSHLILQGTSSHVDFQALQFYGINCYNP